MKRFIAALAALTALVLALSACGSSQYTAYFDPEVTKTVDLGRTATQIPPLFTLSEVEQGTQTAAAQFGATAIVECHVSGKSVSVIEESDYGEPARLLENGDVASADNHVVTPITVTRVYEQYGTSNLKAGDEIDLIETFFYVTEQIPKYAEKYGVGTAVFHHSSYQPLEKDKTYVLFICSSENFSKFNGRSPWNTVFNTAAIYCTSDDSCKRFSTVADYENIWNEVVEKYGK